MVWTGGETGRFRASGGVHRVGTHQVGRAVRRAGPGRASSGTSRCRRRSPASAPPRRPGSPPCPRGPAPRAAPRAGCRSASRTCRRCSPRSVTSAGSSASSVAEIDEPRSPYSSRSSGSASARRTLAARIRSRQALTTTRCSQVVTAASPRNEPALRKAATMPSWSPSAASSGLLMVRSATAQSRSRCRAKRTPKASWSPPTWAASSSGVGPDVGTVVLKHHAPPPLPPSLGTHRPRTEAKSTRR